MMSRTTKDQIRQSHDRHGNAPYWVFRWWLRHGSKRHSAQIRRLENRRRRARARDLLVNEQEPWLEKNGRLAYLYW